MKTKSPKNTVVQWEGKDYPIPFALDLELDKGQMITVKNRFGGASYDLPWFAVAVYDLIMGAEMCQDWDSQREGLEWFSEYFPDAYMALLDQL